MALEKMTGGAAGLNSMQPINGGGIASGVDALKRGPQPGSVPSGAEFQRALEQAGVQTPAQQVRPSVGVPPQAGALKFSSHAIDRMRSRGISFGADEMKGIESAVQKAAGKGSKDTLILSGDNALIVSVKNSTVVTVMDRAAMKDNVFTNIDSTVVL